MTLRRLMELYHAEQQGKQIMRGPNCPVTIIDCDLDDIVYYKSNYYIKDEENEYGVKIN